MTTKVDEIAPGIYRLSTLFPDAGPAGLTFNQFLLDDDEPLLFHTGHRPVFSVGLRGHRPGDAGQPTALDHFRPPRI